MGFNSIRNWKSAIDAFKIALSIGKTSSAISGEKSGFKPWTLIEKWQMSV